MDKFLQFSQIVLVFAAGFLTALIVVTAIPGLSKSKENSVLSETKNPNTITTSANPINSGPNAIVGKVMPIQNIDWKSNGKTLVLYLSVSCHFCTESSPFYKTLVENFGNSNQLKLAAVFPEDAGRAKSHLERLGVNIGNVYSSQLDSIGVFGTPTLLLVNEDGTISEMWRGKLPPDREAQVLAKLSS